MDMKSFTQIATSKDALEKRMRINQNAEKDFDGWSVNILPKIPSNARILDLGCGTGKQASLFAKSFGEEAEIFAVDISGGSLAKLRNTYSHRPRLQLINSSFENFPQHIGSSGDFFDLVYSFYALYYSERPADVISAVYKYLKKGGIFWIVGPCEGTNIEIFDILKKFYAIDNKVIYSIEGFHKDVVSMCKKTGFTNIKSDSFKNRIFFKSAGDLTAYLKNTTFYDERYENAVREKAEKIFSSSREFAVSKNALSIMMEK